MNRQTSSSVVITPSALSRSLLEYAIQARIHIEYIMGLNDDSALEPGHLHGISLMLKNAERAFAEASAALPDMYCMPRDAY